MMPAVNYLIYGLNSARTTPGVSLYPSLALEENSIAVITQGRVKRQIKNRTLNTCRLFLLTQILNITAIGQIFSSFYPPFWFNIHS